MVLGKRLTVQINNGQVRAGTDESLAHDKTKSTSATGDDGSAALEGECRQGADKVYTTSASQRPLMRGQFRLILGVFDDNALVRTGSRALVRPGGGADCFCAGLVVGVRVVLPPRRVGYPLGRSGAQKPSTGLDQ